MVVKNECMEVLSKKELVEGYVIPPTGASTRSEKGRAKIGSSQGKGILVLLRFSVYPPRMTII